MQGRALFKEPRQICVGACLCKAPPTRQTPPLALRIYMISNFYNLPSDLSRDPATKFIIQFSFTHWILEPPTAALLVIRTHWSFSIKVSLYVWAFLYDHDIFVSIVVHFVSLRQFRIPQSAWMYRVDSTSQTSQMAFCDLLTTAWLPVLREMIFAFRQKTAAFCFTAHISMQNYATEAISIPSQVLDAIQVPKHGRRSPVTPH